MQNQFNSKIFEIDYSPSRKNMRNARVMDEGEILNYLKLFEKN
jgi:hypothetical protein